MLSMLHSNHSSQYVAILINLLTFTIIYIYDIFNNTLCNLFILYPLRCCAKKNTYSVVLGEFALTVCLAKTQFTEHFK